MYLFLFNSYHFGSGLYAESDAVRIAGVSVRKVQDLDLEILSILCEVRSYTVFTGCDRLVNCIVITTPSPIIRP